MDGQHVSPEEGHGQANVPLRDRVAHFTWANFVCTQSTGGIAILLSVTPYQFHGLQTIGVVVFIFNIVLFLLFCAAISTRFILHPYTIRRSFIIPPESYFFGSFLLSIATFIICMQRFGVMHTGPWLVVVIRVLFWIYAAVSLLFSTSVWVLLGAKSSAKIKPLQPPIFLIVFNAMLTGTVAGAIAPSQPPSERLAIIVAGIAYQGLGWVLALLLLGWYLGSLVERGPGPPNTRLGLFIPVGSSGYTIVALIGCARNVPQGYGYFASHPNAAEIVQVVALWASIFLWLVSFWIFAVALIACLPLLWPFQSGRFQPRMAFTLSWWSIIFPNVGFTIATAYIGEELESPAIQWVATAMAILLVLFWLMDLTLHLRAMFTGQIMYPGKDEDAVKSK
ncbi:voltage-dependent anion channel [Xylariaceae sp. FL1019]|nr:voltage-dependent anion channel [Xylariaceae sp. FL1019]